MANGHGGSRTPRNPAPVSGPGSLSRRTDGQAARYASGMPYGDGQDFYDLQTQAPMAAAPKMPNVAAPQAQQPASPQATPLFSPTQRPDEPVTSGAAYGPGPGPAQDLGGTVADLMSRVQITPGSSAEYMRELAFRLGV